MAVAGVRHLEHNLLVYRRTWRGTAFSTLISPVLFLSAMGLGLGSLIPGGVSGFDGVSYLAFLAPGLMAAQAMQTATIESSWPLLAGFKWLKTFQGAIATPQRPRDIALGHLYWQVVRVGIVTAVFLVVALAFGAVTLPIALVSWPAAILTGLAFGMPMAAWTATRQTETSFPVIFRFVITPLFHGVTLTRSLALGHGLDPVALGIHVAVLVGLVAAGAAVALGTFRRRLIV